MLRRAADFLQSLRDGRAVYVGGERIDDIAGHAAFRGAAATLAALYEAKADAEANAALSFAEGGERHSAYFLMPRSEADLDLRRRAHLAMAERSLGLMGRGPDHVASFITGLAMHAEVLDVGGRPYGEHLRRYQRYLRDNDLYVSYAVHPASQSKKREFWGDNRGRQAVLRVVGEDAHGVIVDGMKMLATGGVFSDEIWIGNMSPIAEDQKAESITFAVPAATPGVSLWARQPMALQASDPLDYPLTARFDESDVIVVFRQVHVPWERVFVHEQPELSREMYFRTASWAFGNHQANARFLCKLRFIVGLASRIAGSAGVREIPAVRELLGRLAADEALLAGTLHGQVRDHEQLPGGWVAPNRRYVAGALNFCQQSYPAILQVLRELSGGSIFQLPGNSTVLDNPETCATFEAFWDNSPQSALDRYKLYRAAWDLFGSEFGGRTTQYEQFYGGPSFVVRSHSLRWAPWDALHGEVDRFLASVERPDRS